MNVSFDAFLIVTIIQVAILVILSFTYKRARLYGRYFSGYPGIVVYDMDSSNMFHSVIQCKGYNPSTAVPRVLLG